MIIKSITLLLCKIIVIILIEIHKLYCIKFISNDKITMYLLYSCNINVKIYFKKIMKS